MSGNYPQVCVITGGSSGVGLATALRFAKTGSQIAICGRDADRLESARQEIAAVAGESSVLAVVTDVSCSTAAMEFVSRAATHFSRIDLLVNNAAVAPLAPLESMTDDAIDRCVDLNIRSVYYATRTAWRLMKEQGSGLIVNISSRAAVDPFPGFSLYGATKAWIELFTIALAGEGNEHGIRAYCIRPGAVETPMLRGLFSDFPAEQCVSPDEIAETIRAVCGPEFANSSGQVVAVSRQ